MSRHATRDTDELTDREKLFVERYIYDPNGVQAYRYVFPDATYNTAAVTASEWLKKPKIAREVRAARNAAAKRLRISADKVLRELARIAFSDVGDLVDDSGNLTPLYRLPIDTRRAVSGVKVRRQVRRREGEDDVTDSEIEYKLWSKTDALQKLCTHLGLAQEITPLDVLLATLPADVAANVRTLLAGPVLDAGAGEGAPDGDSDE